MTRKQNNLRGMRRVLLAHVSQPMFEALETRRMLSVNPAAIDKAATTPPETTTIQWKGQSTRVVANRWIVTLEQDAPAFDAKGELVSLGMDFVSGDAGREARQAVFDRFLPGTRFERNLGVDNMFTITAPSGMSYDALKAGLQHIPRFVSVEPDLVGTRARVPNDPEYSQQWGLPKIQAPSAWDYTTGWSGSAVAVIDSGVDLDHPDLVNNLWVNPGEIPGNGIDDDGNGGIDDMNGWDFYGNDNAPDDVFGHGTAVAGVVAARGDNSTNITGVSWRNKIIALKDGDADPVASLTVAAINYVTGLRFNEGINVRVINISTGYSSSPYGMYTAINNARGAGIIVVAAAGNSGEDIDDADNLVYPAAYSLDNIISVAASTPTDARAGFSNYGLNNVDLAAPGDDIRLLWVGGGTTVLDGTSFAAPMVAGAAALVFAVKPDAKYLAADQDPVPGVIDAILDNVDAVSAWSGLTKTGGRLNVLNAIQAINPAGIPGKSFIGDGNTAPLADNVTIATKPGDSTITQIKLNGNLFAEVTNSSNPIKRIDVFTLGANDTLTVSSGVLNKIYAGGSEGNDNLSASGASSSVTLSGEAGNDTLTGGAGNDYLEGGSGNDSHVGGSGDDSIFGVNGDDTLYGGIGNDTLKGGNGTDRLYGEAGADRLYSDYENQDDTSLDSIWGGDGTDLAWVGNDPFDWVDGTVEQINRL